MLLDIHNNRKVFPRHLAYSFDLPLLFFKAFFMSPNDSPCATHKLKLLLVWKFFLWAEQMHLGNRFREEHLVEQKT